MFQKETLVCLCSVENKVKNMVVTAYVRLIMVTSLFLVCLFDNQRNSDSCFWKLNPTV